MNKDGQLQWKDFELARSVSHPNLHDISMF